MANEVTFSNDDFYISYNPERDEFAKLCDDIVAAAMPARAPKDFPETALCIRDTTKYTGVAFYILYGDHREAYAKLVPDQAACMDYFKASIVQISHSSDVPPPQC